MNFRRFIIVTLDTSSAPVVLPDCQSASRVGELGDGTALYEIECDPAQFLALTGDGYVLLPGLNAPSREMKAEHLAIFAKHGVRVGTAGDTCLNLLRRLRAAKNLSGDISSRD